MKVKRTNRQKYTSMTKKLHLTISLAASIFLSLPTAAQDVAVPVDLQYALFCKVLSYDRSLMRTESDTIVFCIAYQNRYLTSRNIKDEFIKAIEDSPVKNIQGRKIEYIAMDLMTDDIEKAVESNTVDVLYLTPVRAIDIGTIADICHKHHILSLTGVPEYCENGISVGIGQVGERPQIIVNLKVAKSSGADFSSQFLKLVKVL